MAAASAIDEHHRIEHLLGLVSVELSTRDEQGVGMKAIPARLEQSVHFLDELLDIASLELRVAAGHLVDHAQDYGGLGFRGVAFSLTYSQLLSTFL